MRNHSRETDSNLTRRAFGCGAWTLLGAVVIIGILAAWLASCDPVFMSFESQRNDGTESQRLPVTVEPRVGLADRTVVAVTSDAFQAHEVIGVAVCLEEADTESAGAEACDEVTGARYAVAADGSFRATFPVPRVITVDGVAHDCAAPDRSCLVVAADASDYDVSGGQRISFRTDLGPADLAPKTQRPDSDLLPVLPPEFAGLEPGSVVEVIASGFQPGEPVLLANCEGFPGRSVLFSCDPAAEHEALMAVMGRSTSGVSSHADPTGTARFSFVAEPEITPYPGGQPVDCTIPSSRCSFVIAAAADLKRSAVAPYSLAP